MTQSTQHSNLRFLLEESRTPIYQRILNAFGAALTQAGHAVTWLKRNAYRNRKEVIRFVSSESFDYCLVTNGLGRLSAYFPDINRFLFEFFPARLIFVHHDSLFSFYRDIKMIDRKIQALQRINSRSFHFCIEPYNVKDLNSMGINEAYPFHHASEFVASSESPDVYTSDISFVGHILPNDFWPKGDVLTSNLLLDCFNKRIEAMDRRIETFADTFSDHPGLNADSRINRVIYKYWFISAIHAASQHYRGEVVSRIANHNIDIFGGDPAYLSGRDKNRVIHNKSVRYFPPTIDSAGTQSVYRTSKINLNITSLQFDDAVVNRVIDVCACGGFLLTDCKSGLEELTPLGREISYETVDELNTKIDYYLTHEHERIEIARQMHDDINKKCTYSNAIDKIFFKIEGS